MMYRKVFWFGFLLLACRSAPVDQPPSGPAVEAANSELVPEVETVPNRFGQRIFLHNTSNRSYRITELLLYNCRNVQGGCGRKQIDILIPAGERGLIRVVYPADTNEPIFYQWTFKTETPN
jgi:hypothetical protein